MRRIKEKIEILMILFTILIAILIVITFLVFVSDMDQNISLLPLFYLLTIIFYILNFFNNISERNKYNIYRKNNPKDEHSLLHLSFALVSLLFFLLSFKLLWL